MVLFNIVIAMVIKTAAGILQIFDVPVILVQCIVNHIFIFIHSAHAQQQVCRHEQRIRPCLFREIIVCGNRMLKNAVSEPQGIFGDKFHLAHQDIVIFLFPCRLVQRHKAMPHGTGIHRPYLGKPQINQFIHPVF